MTERQRRWAYHTKKRIISLLKWRKQDWKVGRVSNSTLLNDTVNTHYAISQLKLDHHVFMWLTFCCINETHLSILAQMHAYSVNT